MTYLVKLKENAEKELERLKVGDKKGYFRCCLALIRLSQDPFVGKKLDGEFEGYWSVRVWPYRIIYSVFERELIVYILAVKHRKDAYR